MPGLIHIYCGDGKGKTTAAIGLAVRAAGAGKKVVFTQFFKDGSSSEIKVLQGVENIQVMHSDTVRGFWKRMTDEQKARVSEDYTRLFSDVTRLAMEADLLVLDEIISACNHAAVAEVAVADFLRSKPERLEVVLTVSEEVGLIGATAMDLSACRGRRLINIDSEMEGMLTAGCAGGVRVQSMVPVERECMQGISCEVFFEGLKGGHSGIEINSGLANANVLLGRFLLMLKGKTNYGLAELNGGVKDNVIPKNAKAVVILAEDQLELLKETAEEFNKQFDAEYGVVEKDGSLKVTVGSAAEGKVLDTDSLEKVLVALNVMPNGVQAMSMDLPGLVETSLNMGTVELKEDMLDVGFSIRSSVVSAKENTARKVELLTKALGGTASRAGDYPAWPYARTSSLRDLCVEIYKKQTGKEMKVEVIHAGLECGILSSKLEGLDCISIGPDMVAIHSPNEKLSISSVARVWEYLKEVIAAK